MLSLRQIAEQVYVAGQISPDDLEALASHGFKTIINNRPDQESADQPTSAEMAAKAAALGLSYHHLPLSMGTPPSVELAQAFKQVLDNAEGPVLAFCRSGNRSGQIFQLAQTLG